MLLAALPAPGAPPTVDTLLLSADIQPGGAKGLHTYTHTRPNRCIQNGMYTTTYTNISYTLTYTGTPLVHFEFQLNFQIHFEIKI